MDEENNSLICDYCKVEAPLTLSFLKESWTCPLCAEKPLEDTLSLKALMEQMYHDCRQVEGTRLLYISDIDNNLWKIQQHFKECVDMDNPNCTITLTRPEHVEKLPGIFHRVFIDSDILDKDILINSVDIDYRGMVFYVEPVKQNVIK